MLAIQLDNLSLVTWNPAVEGQFPAIENAAGEAIMVNTCRRVHVWRLESESADGVLRCPPFADFLFEISEDFREEKRRNDRSEEMIEPVCFMQAQAFEGGLVENEVRSRGLAYDSGGLMMSPTELILRADQSLKGKVLARPSRWRVRILSISGN